MKHARLTSNHSITENSMKILELSGISYSANGREILARLTFSIDSIRRLTKEALQLPRFFITRVSLGNP